MDLESRRRWEAYTKAKEEMLERTHIPEAPWWIIEADDKKRARLNCSEHLLSSIPYGDVHHDPVVLPERDVPAVY
jgi:polyphosphate kinase 2 (PPK2 family)